MRISDWSSDVCSSDLAGAGFRSIAEPMVDTTSQFAEFVIAVLGIAASYERQGITERTSAGRVQATARVVKFRLRAALTPHQQSQALLALARSAERLACKDDVIALIFLSSP